MFIEKKGQYEEFFGGDFKEKFEEFFGDELQKKDILKE
jgi:hypothetical protein